MARSRDLFDDTTMSFGEHLEALRIHVFRALIGLILSITVCLFFGDRIFEVLRKPIEQTLEARGLKGITNDAPTESLMTYVQRWWKGEKKPSPPDTSVMKEELRPDELPVRISRSELARHGLTTTAPEAISQNPPITDSSGADSNPSDQNKVRDEDFITLILTAPEFAQLHRVVKDMNRVTTLKAEEGFMTYVKVCCITGFILASPWVFYQLWLFVAAGLHSHERRYVYVYLPMSFGLFVIGALSGFYFAFPLMLEFLVGFNEWLNLTLQPRLSEYISLALILPLMFGISFQLPLVMLFLERISIFSIKNYRENRRMAILVISIVSMVLTTSPDPWSMLLMMIPLIFLYEVGIQLCRMQLTRSAAPIR
ncbi:MAG: twin-arginine translocase subunit TatC [Planctomyces sp.]|jgi:sec-independent protein translocase protein TatC